MAKTITLRSQRTPNVPNACYRCCGPDPTANVPYSAEHKPVNFLAALSPIFLLIPSGKARKVQLSLPICPDCQEDRADRGRYRIKFRTLLFLSGVGIGFYAYAYLLDPSLDAGVRPAIAFFFGAVWFFFAWYWTGLFDRPHFRVTLDGDRDRYRFRNQEYAELFRRANQA